MKEKMKLEKEEEKEDCFDEYVSPSSVNRYTMIMVTPERMKELETYEKMYEECRKDLQDEMATGGQIYESLCYECKRKAEEIIEEDGVVNLWDNMLKDKHKSKQSDVQW